MYFVGIDISKFKHDCVVIDELGDIIQPSWSFGNDCEGFSLLKERIDSLPGEKKIGLEATGHLWAESEAVPGEKRLLVHGVQPCAGIQICSRQIS